MEVHRAKLKASYPLAADKIQMGGPQTADEVYARASRVAIAQGLPTTHPGDALFNLITLSRTWIRPWAFYAIEDKAVRDTLLALFPDGCYVAFAGDTYCESRNETMDDCWRVMHALPGDGQNRPSVGDSLVQIQERYNTLSNIQAETYEYGIPRFMRTRKCSTSTRYRIRLPSLRRTIPRARALGSRLRQDFFNRRGAGSSGLVRHQQELMDLSRNFLPAFSRCVWRRNGFAEDGQRLRDGARSGAWPVRTRVAAPEAVYSDVMLLSVDCFRKNRPEDAEIPILGPGGEFESHWIRLADLKGNIQAYPESDETFPRLKSQQRGVVQQLMASSDPLIQQALADPANIGS